MARVRRAKATPGKARSAKTSSSKRRWSGDVTAHSDALDLQGGLFKGSASQIARGLKAAAEHSARRKGSIRSSATSMLNFYINRAGHNLTPARRKVLEQAKDQLHRLFEDAPAKTAKSARAP